MTPISPRRKTRKALVSLAAFGLALSPVLVLPVAQAHSQDQPMSETSSVTIRGTAVAGGVICPLIELTSGEKIPLVGVALDAFPPGTPLLLTGHVLQRSPCQQGRWAFRVLTAAIAQ